MNRIQSNEQSLPSSLDPLKVSNNFILLCYTNTYLKMYNLDLIVISLGLILFYHIYYMSIFSSQKVNEF